MHATQIANATPFHTGARTGTWALRSQVILPDFLNVANILYAKWNSSMGNTKTKINPLAITYKADVYHAPGRVEGCLSLIEREIKRGFSHITGKHSTCFTDYYLLELCCHNHPLAFVNSEKGRIFRYPH